MYTTKDLESAFERFTLVGIKAAGGEDNPLASIRGDEFVPGSMKGLGLDIEGTMVFCAKIAPIITEMLLATTLQDKAAKGQVQEEGEWKTTELDDHDLESIIATVLIRGIGLGILLKDPELGNDPELLDRLKKQSEGLSMQDALRSI